MPSELFDPLLELALDVAKKDKRAKPPIAPPARIVPMLKFTKVPNRAKDALLEVLENDEKFRSRVLAKADERAVGRVGMSFLERSDGWEDFIARMVEAAAEPLVATPDKSLERRVEAAERQRATAEDALAAASVSLDAQSAEVGALVADREALEAEVARLATENVELTQQRRRAVSELKRTEAVMARHIAERKRLEAQVELMSSAQLATSAVGGGITDAEVRSAVDSLEPAIDALRAQLDDLRMAATPQRVVTPHRTPLPVPPGLFDDSVEYAEYLLSMPRIIVLVDGYNITREAHDDWELEQQRTWLEQGLRAVSARWGAVFDVVFDGADVGATDRGARDRNVSVRFSPDGVEADDVLIRSVASVAPDRPVAVVSSDRRVRSGAASRGANVLYSHQLLAVMG